MTILPKQKQPNDKSIATQRQHQHQHRHQHGPSSHGHNHQELESDENIVDSRSSDVNPSHSFAHHSSPPRWPQRSIPGAVQGDPLGDEAKSSRKSSETGVDHKEGKSSNSKRRHPGGARGSLSRNVKPKSVCVSSSFGGLSSSSDSLDEGSPPLGAVGGHEPDEGIDAAEGDDRRALGSESPSGYNSGDEYGGDHGIMPAEEVDEKEREFEMMIRKKGWVIKKMGEDGACLFRAVADQVYGDQDMHDEVRNHCMDYMMKNADYFSQYVTEDFEQYISRKRNLHCHGNHIEIQAMSEMFLRPIEVYSYSLTPINTFQGNDLRSADTPPIRLSYHRGVHYNSIVDPYNATIGVGLGLPGYNPGIADKKLMEDAIRISENDSEMLEKAMLKDKLRETDWEATAEAIQEQVARESYMDYIRELEKRTKKPKSHTASFKSSSTSGATATVVSSSAMQSPQTTCSSANVSQEAASSPKLSSNFKKSPSPGRSASSKYSPGRASPRVKSPKASASGSPRFSPKASSSGIDRGVGMSGKKSSPNPPRQDAYASSLNEFALIDETASFMDQIPPQALGISDWDDSGVLARVLAQSQQEYLDSLKKKASSSQENSIPFTSASTSSSSKATSSGECSQHFSGFRTPPPCSSKT